MDKIKKCSVCNIKLDINNYMKDRTVRKDCYDKKKKKQCSPKRNHYFSSTTEN